jgi:phenylalanyl-tRNA synthetase beta chain
MEINLDKLLEKKTGKMTFKEISKYPSVKQDIAVVVDKTVTAATLESEIKKAGGKLFSESKVFDVFEGPSVGLNKKSVAISLTFGSNERTLTDEEVAAAVDAIVERLQKQCGANLRK